MVNAIANQKNVLVLIFNCFLIHYCESVALLGFHPSKTDFIATCAASLPLKVRLQVTIVEGNSLVGGANSFVTPHPPPKVVPLPPLGKAFLSIPSRRFTTLWGRLTTHEVDFIA